MGKSSIFWLLLPSIMIARQWLKLYKQTNNINHWVVHLILIVIVALELFFRDSQAHRCYCLVLFVRITLFLVKSLHSLSRIMVFSTWSQLLIIPPMMALLNGLYRHSSKEWRSLLTKLWEVGYHVSWLIIEQHTSVLGFVQQNFFLVKDCVLD